MFCTCSFECSVIHTNLEKDLRSRMGPGWKSQFSYFSPTTPKPGNWQSRPKRDWLANWRQEFFRGRRGAPTSKTIVIPVIMLNFPDIFSSLWSSLVSSHVSSVSSHFSSLWSHFFSSPTSPCFIPSTSVCPSSKVSVSESQPHLQAEDVPRLEGLGCEMETFRLPNNSEKLMGRNIYIYIYMGRREDMEW